MIEKAFDYFFKSMLACILLAFLVGMVTCTVNESKKEAKCGPELDLRELDYNIRSAVRTEIYKWGEKYE